MMFDFRLFGWVLPGLVILFLLWLPADPDSFVSAWPTWVRLSTTATGVLAILLYRRYYSNRRR
ncbi:MAG: hypothetical protein OXH72_12680 [Caldilineaceae bacterium]|nr:hypothetical protein [Caldilineaceae bacterium]